MDSQTEAVATLLAEAARMHGGDAMLRRYASRQGWVRTDGTDGGVLASAAVFVVAAGRGWGDVLRAAS